MPRAVLTEDAESDLVEIIHYIAREDGVDRALAIEDRIRDRIKKLEQAPYSSPPAEDIDPETRCLVIQRWEVYYDVVGELLVVTTIVDSARAPARKQRIVLERQGGRKALVVECDATSEEHRQLLIEQAVAEYQRLDILVNNAGGAGPKPALDTTPEEFDAVLHFNCTSAFSLSRLAAPHMAKAGKGSIVNISSVAARFAQPCFAAYGVGKAAMDMLTRNLAQDFAPIVRVNGIAVGTTMTTALEDFMSEDMEAAMLQHTPMGRLGKPEDVAACVLFLASPAADYVTGEIYGVNGGLARTPAEMPRTQFAD